MVDKFVCGRCHATYYSETCGQFKVRVSISPYTNKRPKSKQSTAV